MTIASTLVQILYELGQLLVKKSHSNSGSKKGNPLIIIGIFSYIFYFIATYLLLFLSRTREYGADAFAASQIKDPNALSQALIKIAYGIVAKPEDDSSQRLLNSTRALGIFDNKAAKNFGHLAGPDGDKTTLGKVLLFDFVSPWGKILELASTHPLTGKRIKRLGELGTAKGQKPLFDFESLKNSISVDSGKLWSGFWTGALFYYAPGLLILIGLVISYFNFGFTFFIPALFGVGILLRAFYRYPSGKATPSTVLEAMTDIYASPVRGKKIMLAGQIIGRGQAGAYLSEDLMLQDSTGLVYLNYESAIPLLGNLFAALGKIKKLIGEKVQSSGWFFRGLYHHIDLERVTPEKSKSFRSHPLLAQILLATGAIAFSIYLFSLGIV